MNVRFKSLANIWANRRQVEDRLGVVYVFTEEALQVYSEKIIKECIAKVAEWDMGIDHPVGATDNTSELAREMVAEIKKQFGVEE